MDFLPGLFIALALTLAFITFVRFLDLKDELEREQRCRRDICRLITERIRACEAELNELRGDHDAATGTELARIFEETY